MINEVEFVDGCPFCETCFVGLSPDEMRGHMVGEHSPLAKLVVFSGGDAWHVRSPTRKRLTWVQSVVQKPHTPIRTIRTRSVSARTNTLS
jgi:hypothetical protein